MALYGHDELPAKPPVKRKPKKVVTELPYYDPTLSSEMKDDGGVGTSSYTNGHALDRSPTMAGQFSSGRGDELGRKTVEAGDEELVDVKPKGMPKKKRGRASKVKVERAEDDVAEHEHDEDVKPVTKKKVKAPAKPKKLTKRQKATLDGESERPVIDWSHADQEDPVLR